jgi:nucleoside-diphosphate-sugar epimerase
MKILVTGCAGYVGTSTIPALLDEGWEVIGFDNLMFGGNQLLGFYKHKNFTFIQGDVTNKEEVKKVISGVDIIIHLAAIVGFPACERNPELTKAVNVMGTKNIVESASKDQLILFGSTGSNYGAVDDICTEETPLNPLSLYAETKTTAEQIVLQSGNAIAYRFATAFGVSPRMRLDLLVNDFVNKLFRDGYLVVYEKRFLRTFIHVTDMAASFVFAIKNMESMRGNVYNVGDESMNYTKGEICEIINEHVSGLIHYAEVGSDADKRNYQVSFERIKKLGFTSTISLNEGVSEIASCVKIIDRINPYVNSQNI